MISEYFLTLLVFMFGLYSISGGKRSPKTTAWVGLLVGALIVWQEKGPIELLLFVSMFITLLFATELDDKRSHKQRHSSIQEKAILYVSVLPTFGFYFLFRDQIESKLREVSFSGVSLVHFEWVLIICTVVTTMAFLKNKARI